jgi:uncharacterized membrane protein YfcA
MGVKAGLFAALAAIGAAFIGFWARDLQKKARSRAAPSRRDESPVWPTPYTALVGLVTDFFDTLGIGSFATTTSLYRLRRAVPDRLIPGTLNVGHTLPTLAQAFIYIAIVRVENKTLVAMIAAAVAGAWLGASSVARWPTRPIRIGLAVALLWAAALLFAQQLRLLPPGGQTLGLDGARLAFAIAGNFVLGALMTLGLGLYAPCMILVSGLGMSVVAAFPIMMGSCAFLMPVAGARFIARGSYASGAALGLSLGGIPAVLVAAYIVRSLPLQAMRWLVLVVVLITAITMLRAAVGGTEKERESRSSA